MIISYETFSFLVIFAIFTPLAGAIVLLVVLAFEKQIDGLTFEKQQVLLEKELQESEYMQLNQQIQPHFLFNTMNLMLGLARLNRKDTLIQAIEALSRYLKFKYQVKEQFIPLEKEWSYTQSYINIQELRFQDRLTVDMELDSSIQDALIPPYLIQTLVENSFKHGLEKKQGQLRLTLQAIPLGEHIQISVTDNGIGIGDLTKEKLFEKGHGLPNIQRRLELLYEESTLTIEPLQTVGTKASITLPIFTSEEDEEGND